MSKIVDDPRIDAGIESYPLADLPDGFMARTIERLESSRQASRVNLRFTEIAIPVFFVLFALIFAGVVVWGVRVIDPVWVEYFKLKITYYQLRILPAWTAFQNFYLIGAGVMFLVLMEVIWVVSRPRRVFN
jgi:hypothetical protein